MELSRWNQSDSMLQDTMPGWLYAIKKGATTIWECWDGINEQGMVRNSLNHYSYGAICGWLFSGICGIRIENGEIFIRPQPYYLLQHANASYRFLIGEVSSRWYYEGTKLNLRYRQI